MNPEQTQEINTDHFNVEVDAKAIAYFEKELEMVQDATLQALFYNALAVSPQSFHDDEELMEHSKKAFHILRGVLGQKGVQGSVRDALLGTTLICDIMYNEFEEELRSLHTVAARVHLENLGVHKDIQLGLWENIMRAVEGHNGSGGSSPMLEAKPGTAEYEVANAFLIANLGYVNFDWEVIYSVGQTESGNEN